MTLPPPELAPYERNILRLLGIRGPFTDWHPVQYTIGTIADSGPLRLLATNDTLGVYVSASNDLCYHLAPIKHFTGSALTDTPTDKQQPQTKPKRQNIIDSL